MQASCQGDRGCTDTVDGGHFTMRYIVGMATHYFYSRSVPMLSVTITTNILTLGLPILLKYIYYSIRFDYQPVHTKTDVEILMTYNSFTAATLTGHGIN